ncbi:MAG: FTR1 family protein [Dehalococcoidia bacterium]|nr:FTR1 family protein [Dehalococcoidia bacterium]
MVYSLFVSLREGLEAFLIIAIVLGYLNRIGQRRYFTHVWLGAALAFLGTIAVWAGLELTASKLSGPALEAFEGGATLLAVVVLTSMTLWMKRQAADMGSHLRSQVDVALRSGSVVTLVLLAFTSVGREGLETALFLTAGSATADSALLYWLGAGLGLAVAAVMGAIVYAGTMRLPLSAVFNVTGVILIVLAAGLLSSGLKELSHATSASALGPHLWDTYNLVPDNSGLGRLLNTVLGYDASPRLGQVVAYLGYLAVFLPLFLLGREKPPVASQTTTTPMSTMNRRPA